MKSINNSKKISSRAWETWNVIVTMLEVILEKVERDPLHRSSIIRTWEVWGSPRRGEKKRHKKGIVYHVFDLLNKIKITQPVEDFIEPPPTSYEVRFTQNGVIKLLNLAKGLNANNRLELTRIQVLRELLEEFNRNVDWTIP